MNEQASSISSAITATAYGMEFLPEVNVPSSTPLHEAVVSQVVALAADDIQQQRRLSSFIRFVRSIRNDEKLNAEDNAANQRLLGGSE